MNIESITIFLALVCIHWVTDFVLQDEQWAINKWTSFKALVSHTLMYSLSFGLFLGIFLFFKQGYVTGFQTYLYPVLEFLSYNQGFKPSLLLVYVPLLIFVGITFVLHTLTDFLTSKVVHGLFENKKFGSPIPNLGAFSAIGFDQVLHYIQLVLTYYLCFR